MPLSDIALLLATVFALPLAIVALGIGGELITKYTDWHIGGPR